MNRDQFFSWAASRSDSLEVWKECIDMAGDINAGIMLSQIVSWHLSSNENAQTELWAKRGDHLWLVKAHTDWYDEIRFTADQARRALRVLEEKKLVITKVHQFNGTPTKHIRINWPAFWKAWESVLSAGSEQAGDLGKDAE